MSTITNKAVGLIQMRELLSDRPQTTTEIAEKLGRDKRTIQRWVYDLEEIGVPLIRDGNRIGVLR